MENRTGVEIAPQRLGHLNLFVTDYEKSGQFYSKVCGFQEVFREPGISMIFMSNGNTHHDLGLMEITTGDRIGKDGHVQVAAGNGRTPGLNHLGFEMRTEQQLVDAYRRAKSKNVPINRSTLLSVTFRAIAAISLSWLTRSKNFSKSRSTTQRWPAAMYCCALAIA